MNRRPQIQAVYGIKRFRKSLDPRYRSLVQPRNSADLLGRHPPAATAHVLLNHAKSSLVLRMANTRPQEAEEGEE